MKFFKYQGTGNDFVIIDNRNKQYNHDVKSLCDRKFGIGADGLMLLESEEEFDFRMVYFNSDGNESTMCGNGGRCIVAFAKSLGIIKDSARFIAIDGPHEANIDDNGIVALGMLGVEDIERLNENEYVLDTGSPHYVQFIDDVNSINIIPEAHAIRYGNRFAKEGINVNFVEDKEEMLKVRTYERGVEDETLSCGTGVTAVALAYHQKRHAKDGSFSQKLEVEGGNLEVSFQFHVGIGYREIKLIGPAVKVFEGEI